jgi:hypothetical protein
VRGEFDARRRLPIVLAMLADDCRVNSAAYVEFGCQTKIAGAEDADQIREHPVRHRFVERADIAIRPDVELQGLELHAQRVRNILEV